MREILPLSSADVRFDDLPLVQLIVLGNAFGQRYATPAQL
jgi:hypothetical protein